MEQHLPIPKEWNLNEKGILAFSGNVARPNELASYVQRAEIEQLWTRDLNQGAQSEASNFMHFVIGNLGQGKSISLLKINEMILTDYAEVLLPVVLTFVAEDTLRPRDFLFRLLAQIDYAGLAKRFQSSDLDKAIKRIPSGYEESQTLMNNLLLPQRSRATNDTFFPELQWTQAVADETHRAAHRYFLGQSVTQKELRLLGLSHRLDSEEAAWKHITAIRWVLGGLGYSAVVMLVDEFEYLFSLVSRNRRPQYVALLRRLFDSSSSGPFMAGLNSFFAISAEGWQQLTDLPTYEVRSAGPTQALQRRLSSSTLTNLESQQTRALIEKRLQTGRERPAGPEEAYSPFTADFLGFVQEQTMGIPGDIVKFCHNVLSAGRSRQIAQLDKAFAIRVIAERS